MICRMCLLDSAGALSIFEPDCDQLQIAATIARHFWFEPTKDDPISNMICYPCWSKIEDFHIYYVSVEEAQWKLPKMLAVKEESSVPPAAEYLKEETAILEESTILDEADEEADRTEHKKITPEIEKLDFSECSLDEEPVTYPEPIISDEEEDEDDFGSSSDDEPLAKKLQQIKKENADKNESKKLSALKASRESLNTDTDTENPIKIEDNDLSSEANKSLKEERPKKKRGRKKKSEKIERVVKAENSEYRKKSKEYDDDIAQFMKLKCDLCMEDFRTFAEVKRHYRSVHNRKGYIICCSTRKFYKRVFLYEHIQKHKNPDHFKCHFCEKVYCSASVLRSHILTHDASFEKLFQCDKCPRRFAKLSILNHHKIIHIPKHEHTFCCDVCGKSFPTKNTMQTHRKCVHEKAYAKMCHICAKVICGKTLFAKHQLEHVGITDPRVKCEQCGTWLKNAFRLKIHTKKHHTDDSPCEHICNICGKISPSSVGLKSHIRYVHSAIRKYQCSVCIKGFKTALNLKEHMTTHTGDILYTCPHCPKTFNSSANMHSHRKKMHREEWEESRRNRGLPIETTSSIEKEIVKVEKEETINAVSTVIDSVAHDFDYVPGAITCRLDNLL